MNAKKNISREKLDAARQTAEKRFAHRPSVTGVDVGYKWSEGKRTKELCVRVHVREKIPLSALEAAEIFPEDIDGVPVDVIQGHYQVRRATLPSEHSARFPVLFGGISIAHKDVTAGTLGTMVIDNDDGRPGLLSNWHVLSGPTGRPGDEVLQPGPFDGGTSPGDSVASLGRSILDADGDAAVAFFNGARPWLPFIFGGFDHPVGLRDSVLGETLKKSGRTTAQTSARVDGEGKYFLEYEVRPGVIERIGVLGFKLVSEIQDNPNNDELSSGGDSGALWYNPNSREAVGLHFAGETDPNPKAEHAIACNMTNVMRKLNVRLATAEDLLNTFGGQQSAGAPASQAETAFTGGGLAGSGFSVGNQPVNTDLGFSPYEPRRPRDWSGWLATGMGWPPRDPRWPPYPPYPPYPPFPPQPPIRPDYGFDPVTGAALDPLVDSDLEFFDNANLDADTAALERLSAAQSAGSISIPEIWARFKGVLADRDVDISKIKPSSKAGDEIGNARILSAFANLLNRSRQFKGDGLFIRPGQIRFAKTIGDIVKVIINWYRSNGWSVSNF